MGRRRKTDKLDNLSKNKVEVLSLIPQEAIDGASISHINNNDALLSPEVTNSKIAAFTFEVLKIRRKADVNDIDSLYDCFNEYLALCSNANMKISNLMAYSSCGLSKQQIDYWSKGTYHANDPRYKEFANTVKAICAANREQLANEGKINPVFAIWQQKCHDGFRDNELITIAEERERSKSSAEILEEFADL